MHRHTPARRFIRRIVRKVPGLNVFGNGWSAGPLHVTTRQRSAHLAAEFCNLPAAHGASRVAWISIVVGSPTVHHWWAFDAHLYLPARLIPLAIPSTGYRQLIG